MAAGEWINLTIWAREVLFIAIFTPYSLFIIPPRLRDTAYLTANKWGFSHRIRECQDAYLIITLNCGFYPQLCFQFRITLNRLYIKKTAELIEVVHRHDRDQDRLHREHGYIYICMYMYHIASPRDFRTLKHIIRLQYSSQKKFKK